MERTNMITVDYIITPNSGVNKWYNAMYTKNSWRPPVKKDILTLPGENWDFAGKMMHFDPEISCHSGRVQTRVILHFDPPKSM